MKLAIGSDKSGFAVKEAIKAYLTGAGVECDARLGKIRLDRFLHGKAGFIASDRKFHMLLLFDY